MSKNKTTYILRKGEWGLYLLLQNSVGQLQLGEDLISLNSRRWKLLSFLHQLPPRGICPSVYSPIHPVIPLTIHSLTYSPTHPNTQPCISPVIHASLQPSSSHSSIHSSLLSTFIKHLSHARPCGKCSDYKRIQRHKKYRFVWATD